MHLLAQVGRTIEEYRLLQDGDAVVVGVSGGPDSVCLLHALLVLRSSYRLGIQVAHLNHGFRGEAADEDAAFVLALAARWGLPAVAERVNVSEYADRNSLAFEEAARRLRYAYLARVAEAVGASRIAVGHSADDQAETVLMHLLRGAGLSGLRGMLPLTPLSAYRVPDSAPVGRSRYGDADAVGCRRWRSAETATEQVGIIRPLLGTARVDIERYCAENRLESRFDRSNLDTTFFRNRMRHELLPELEGYNPHIRERLCHTATVIAAEHDLVTELADRAWASVARYEGTGAGIVLEKAAWQGLPTALQRAALRRAVFELRPGLRDLGFVHIEGARRVGLTGRNGARATLPANVVMVVGYDSLTISETGAAPVLPDQPFVVRSGPIALAVPGTTAMPGGPWVVVASVLDRWDMTVVRANSDRWAAYFDLDRLVAPILIRSRRPGDVFRPQGMGGHRTKVNALMINRKVPREARDHVPLLTGGGVVAWVCGLHVAEGAGVRADTKRVLYMQFQRRPPDGVTTFSECLGN